MKKYYFVLVLPILFLGCSKFEKQVEIEKTPLYKEVINHYEKLDPDEQKRQAALFLLKHIDKKNSNYSPAVYERLEFFSDSIRKQNIRPSEDEIKDKLKQISPSIENAELISDLSVLKSTDLISHIDITYRNWKKRERKTGVSFEEFCEYILPYRVMDEPCIELVTGLFENTYEHAIDSLMEADTFINEASKFIESFNCALELSLSSNYNTHFSAKHVYSLRMVSNCTDNCIFMSLVFRANGIPATVDYTPQWGNDPHSGHSWLSLKWKGKWYAFDAFNGEFNTELYKKESIAKAFRYQYSLNPKTNSTIADVTSQYRQTFEIKLDIENQQLPKGATPALAIFNYYKVYNPISLGKIKRKTISFQELGAECIYFVGYVKDKSFTPFNTAPLYVDSLGNIHKLIANHTKQKSISLLRKYPLTMGARYTRFAKTAKDPSGSHVEASNDNFRTIDTLFAIKNYNSFKEEYFRFSSRKPYRSLRFVLSPGCDLAELSVYDEHQNCPTAKLSGNYSNELKMENLFDDDVLTYVDFRLGKKKIYIVFNFDQTKYVSGFSMLARNDGNHIETGDLYELLIWDNGWQSMGTKIAEEQALVYANVPTGGLYWLRNLTKGKDELPFMMTASGEQYWIGCKKTTL